MERQGGHGPDDGAEDVERFAVSFEQEFRRVYLWFHRRDGPRSDLTGASRAVLTHLAHTGPLTVGEAALHLGRAQSVVSDIVSQLADKGLLARGRDPADRRRTLVWLTDQGLAELDRDRRVLSLDLLAAAVARTRPQDRRAVLSGLRALLAVAPEPSGTVATEGERG
jgi:DNA-binding MarR family transcriptional regulator